MYVDFQHCNLGGVKGKRGTTKGFRKKPSERPTNPKTAMILRNESALIVGQRHLNFGQNVDNFFSEKSEGQNF